MKGYDFSQYFESLEWEQLLKNLILKIIKVFESILNFVNIFRKIIYYLCPIIVVTFCIEISYTKCNNYGTSSTIWYFLEFCVWAKVFLIYWWNLPAQKKTVKESFQFQLVHLFVIFTLSLFSLSLSLSLSLSPHSITWLEGIYFNLWNIFMIRWTLFLLLPKLTLSLQMNAETLRRQFWMKLHSTESKFMNFLNVMMKKRTKSRRYCWRIEFHLP